MDRPSPEQIARYRAMTPWNLTTSGIDLVNENPPLGGANFIVELAQEAQSDQAIDVVTRSQIEDMDAEVACNHALCRWVRLFRVAQEAELRWPTARAFVAVEDVSRTPS